jgi:hypothetical protein
MTTLFQKKKKTRKFIFCFFIYLLFILLLGFRNRFLFYFYVILKIIYLWFLSELFFIVEWFGPSQHDSKRSMFTSRIWSIMKKIGFKAHFNIHHLLGFNASISWSENWAFILGFDSKLLLKETHVEFRKTSRKTR